MAENKALLYGGTFDPIHHGHLIISRAVAEKLGIGAIILIPSARPPHKRHQTLTAPLDRLNMVTMAVQDDPLYQVSSCEFQRESPSYTLDTIRHFQQEMGSDTALYWLIGADTIKDLPDWYQIEELVETCAIVTAARPGCKLDYSLLQGKLTDTHIARLAGNVIPTPHIDISSTAIRHRVRQGLSIRYLVPPAVENYILHHQLYRKTEE